MQAGVLPLLASIDPITGISPDFDEHYVKYFADVADIYADRAAALDVEPDAVAYEVYSNTRVAQSGALVFGTSVLLPRIVGDEFAMTRGHLHEITDRAELYFCLSGAGLLLMEHLDGRTVTQPLTPGAAVYVPGGWIHRSVNTGPHALVTLFCFSADAGQDYAVIDETGGMAMRVVSTSDGGWRLTENENYRPRRSPAYSPS